MANTRMSLSHSKYLQRYLKTRYIHGVCGLGMQQYAMQNPTIQKTNFFELGVCTVCMYVCLGGFSKGTR